MIDMASAYYNVLVIKLLKRIKKLKLNNVIYTLRFRADKDKNYILYS